jgi:hypothetical protein
MVGLLEPLVEVVGQGRTVLAVLARDLGQLGRRVVAEFLGQGVGGVVGPGRESEEQGEEWEAGHGG